MKRPVTPIPVRAVSFASRPMLAGIGALVARIDGRGASLADLGASLSREQEEALPSLACPS